MPTSEPTICTACAEVVTGPGVTQLHLLMLRQGQRTLSLLNEYAEQYRCLECDTAWQQKK